MSQGATRYTHCRDCGAVLVPSSIWKKMPQAQRRVARAAGQRMHGGRGWCNADYVRHYRAGDFQPRPKSPNRAGRHHGFRQRYLPESELNRLRQAVGLI